MTAFTDDERDWLQRFQHHLSKNVLPILHTSTTIQLNQNLPASTNTKAVGKHIMEAINSHLSPSPILHQSGRASKLQVPVEYDILSIEFLKTKFTSSFRAEIFLGTTSSATSDNLAELPTSVGQMVEGEKKSADRYGVTRLHEVPVVLVGCLKYTSNRESVTGRLVLQDATGQLDCEICHQALPDYDCVNQIIVLLKWNYIHSTNITNISYLEVQEFVAVNSAGNTLCLSASQLPQLPQLADIYSVISLKEHLSQNTLPKKAVLNVYGKVTALSDVYRGMYFLIKINADTTDSGFQQNIIVENQCLFHFSRLIKLHSIYLFTNLQDKAVKGARLEKIERVLSSTKETLIFSYEVPTVQSEAASPPRKKMKTEDGSSSSHHCNATDTANKMDDSPVHNQPLQKPLISYTGVITKCVLPDGGVYELDGRVRLYLTKVGTATLCRGLRCGATLELHNVHLLKITTPELKHASGFCCCSLSSVRVAQFSSFNTPFKAYVRNKLASLAKQHNFHDMAWILWMYISLINNDVSRDQKRQFATLVELCKLAALSPIKPNMHSEFLSNPHRCESTMAADLSERPLITSLGHFLEEVDKKVNSREFYWFGGGQEDNVPTADASPFVAFAVCAQWSFGIIRSSEILRKSQVLVGTLRLSDSTGNMELVDKTASVPLVCSVPVSSLLPLFQSAQSMRNLLLGGVECEVLVTDSCVFVERSIEGHQVQPQTVKLLPYLFVKQCRIVPTEPDKMDGAASSKNTSESGAESHQQCLYFVVLNKNIITQRRPLPSSTIKSQTQMCSFSVQALVHTNIDVLTDSSVKSISKDSREKDDADSNHQPLHIALNFSLSFYSFINKGCLYSISLKPSRLARSFEPAAECSTKLPTLKTLADEPYIDVTNDFKVEFVSFSHPHAEIKTPLDVKEVISKVFLPKFSTAVCSTKDTRYDSELVMLRGLIVKHAYRIDHVSTMVGPGVASTSKPSSPSRIIVLTVRSMDAPDTIMVYCEFREGLPLPLGLLPGATATFNSFKLKSSKLGNVYCTSTACSSIVVNCLDGVEAFSSISSPADSSLVTHEMLNLPTTHLGSMMENLVRGSLPGSVVCIVGKFVQVLRLSVQYKCLGCQSTVVNGSCMTSCLKRKHVLKSEGRVIIEDGSGEGHVYVNDGVLRETIGVSASEWGELCDIVEQIGQVVYSGRSSFDKLQSAEHEPGNRFSLVHKAQDKISRFVSLPSFHRTVKLFCQPFVSQAELKECVIGQKRQTLRQYSTLALPRLQLRAIAVVDLNSSHVISRECEQLLQVLNK